ARPRCARRAAGTGAADCAAAAPTWSLAAGAGRARAVVAGDVQRSADATGPARYSALRLCLGNHHSWRKRLCRVDPGPGRAAGAAGFQRPGYRADSRQRNPRHRPRRRPAELGRLAGGCGADLRLAAAFAARTVLPVALAQGTCSAAPGSATAGLPPTAGTPA